MAGLVEANDAVAIVAKGDEADAAEFAAPIPEGVWLCRLASRLARVCCTEDLDPAAARLSDDMGNACN